MIPYGRQDISQEDIDAVVAVLKSDFLTQGPLVAEFESNLSAHIGADHAVAVNSATSALHIACLALGLGPGDTLWTSPITFVASANAALYCGADVDFVDIDPETFNMCPIALAEKLEAAERDGKLPKIVVPVALCGQSCDMKSIKKLSEKYGFRILEDASHAIGARYAGSYVGSGEFSDISVFSFHPVKIITTAEGGVATTNDPILAQKMRLLRSHGVTRDPSLMNREPDGPWYYQQVELGFNYRMTELQAALGVSQMKRLDRFVERRAKHARNYDEALADLPLELPKQSPETASSWHLYVIRVLDSKHHKELFESLRSRGIGVNLHYIPVHTQPYYQKLGFQKGSFPQAEDYYARAMSIPLYAQMKVEDQKSVIDAIQELV